MGAGGAGGGGDGGERVVNKNAIAAQRFAD